MKPLLLALAVSGSPAITDEPVDDKRLEAELAKLAEAQVGAGKAAKADALKTQLDRRRSPVRKPGGARETPTITADCARSSSGRPVFDDCGNVVGMVATTDSFYYIQNNGQQKNLQIVFKNCVSTRSIIVLIEPKPSKQVAP